MNTLPTTTIFHSAWNLLITQQNLTTIMLLGFISIVSYYAFYRIRFTNNRIVRKFLHVPAPKSTTDAVQLGGLPFAILTIFTLGTLILFPSLTRGIFSQTDLLLIKHWVTSSALIIFYGYFDDRYEIKPTVKLGTQLLIAGYFSYNASLLVFPQNSAIAMILIFGVSIMALNGTNLLDGLDTMAFKIACGTYLAFLAIGTIFASLQTVFLSMLFPSLLLGFYLFNRAPAKVHLGEIGPTFIGFSHVLLMSMAFKSSIPNKGSSIDYLSLLATVSIPVIIICLEITISFLRRIYNKKSPFRGDRLHVHHLLRDKFQIAPHNVGTIMGGFQAILTIMSITLSQVSYAPAILVLHTTIMTMTFLMIGKKHWKGSNTLSFNIHTISNMLLKKKVIVLHSSAFDSFSFNFNEEETVAVEHNDRAA